MNKKKIRTATGSRDEQAQATRDLLIRCARELFANRGYHAVGTDALVEYAGLTRGALYHHFDDKAALFLAVFEHVQIELETLAHQSPSPAAGAAWAAFRMGLHAYLDRVLQPDVGRIILIDGPVVLGWKQWRALILQHSLELMTAGLQAAIDEGSLARQYAAPLAQLILAAVEEAALMIVHADDRRAERKRVGATLDHMLNALGGRRAQQTATIRSVR